MGITFKKVTKIASSIIFWFLMVIIVFLVGYLLLINTYKRQGRLEDVPINFYTILTQSMYPKIKAGDIIVTYKNKDDIYKIGDTITFVSESNVSKGVTITHRIVDISKQGDVNYYKTKGDANNTEDFSPVSEGNVIGKVILKIPKAGFLQQFLVTKFGWLVMIVLPCLAIIIYDIIKIIKKLYEQTKKNKLLKKPNILKSKQDLNNLINNNNVSIELQDKFNAIYDSHGISDSIKEKEEEIEMLEDLNQNVKKEEVEADAEIL